MVQQPPATSGIELANWYWKVVRQYVSERCGVSLSRSSCLNYLHRLGFAFKRPKKRLLKADAEKREAFVVEYAALREEAGRTGARILFADEAHFRADAELRGKWVLRGEPALVDSTSPRYGEKASYYSAVCLETGEVDWKDYPVVPAESLPLRRQGPESRNPSCKPTFYWQGYLDSRLIPNPPMDTDGRREDSGRGVRELQGR